MKVGFIGLGLMGAPMAANLVAAGHDVVVWNRTPTKAEPLVAAGAEAADSPAGVAAAGDVVCLSLPTGAEVRAVLDAGVLDALAAKGGIVVDHSTIDPDEAADLAATCAEVGVGFLDAPVSGGPWGAEAGTLCVMVGGDEATVQRARPILEASAKKVIHVGPAGSGQVVKLANNLCFAVQTLGVAEAFNLCGRAGLDPAVTFDVLTNATADSLALRTRAPVPGLVPDMPASNDFAPGFAVDMMAKDLDLAISSAGRLGLPVPATAMARMLLELAQKAGLGAKDFSVVATLVGDNPVAG